MDTAVAQQGGAPLSAEQVVFPPQEAFLLPLLLLPPPLQVAVAAGAALLSLAAYFALAPLQAGCAYQAPPAQAAQAERKPVEEIKVMRAVAGLLPYSSLPHAAAAGERSQGRLFQAAPLS
jgi:hypothetical protein